MGTPAPELGPEISPDGRYLSYMSNETGVNEIYIKSFPTGEGKWQVSTNGGAWAKWSRSGDSIIYRQGAGMAAAMMRVEVDAGPPFRLGAPETLFTARDVPQLVYSTGAAAFDVTSDPNVFIMLEAVGDERERVSRLIFAEDWHASHLLSRGHAN